MDKEQRYEAALADYMAKLKADPKNEKYRLNVALYKKAVANIKEHGNANGPKAKPHPGDANINM